MLTTWTCIQNTWKKVVRGYAAPVAAIVVEEEVIDVIEVDISKLESKRIYMRLIDYAYKGTVAQVTERAE